MARILLQLLLHLLPFLLLAPSVLAQRPKSADEAMQRYQQVRELPASERRRAVSDLGNFDSEEITAALLQELARAEDLSHQQVVVRALGAQPRNAAVAPLQQVLQTASNSRLMDTAAEALAKQGDAGVAALAKVLAEESRGGYRRTAACEGLGRAGSEAARDVLLAELKKVGGRDRLALLRALQRWQDDASVDALRLALVDDRDSLVAATALRQLAEHRHPEAARVGRQLQKRLAPDASSEHYTAVLHALLTAPTTAEPDAVLAAAGKAEDPFGNKLLPAWREAVGEASFRRFLLDSAASRKLPAERGLCAQALALADSSHHKEVAATLQRLLSQKEPEVVRKAADALAACGPELALPPLQKLLASGPEAMQPAALHALHSLQQAEAAWAEVLVQHADSKPVLLRTAALQLLATIPQLDPTTAVAVAAQSLNHAAWQVRSAAIDLLAASRQAAAIPLLIDRLETERARLLLDVQDALYALTGMRLADVATWRTFWQREGQGFQVPPVAKNKDKAGKRPESATVASYWSIPVQSERVAFVIDTSGSMNQPFGTGGSTRLDEAKRQLIRVIELLPNKAKANAIAFASGAEPMNNSLQLLDDKKKKQFEQFAQKLVSRGSTNVHAGLQQAFADAEVDTIFLLTDGAPSSGEIVEPAALRRAVAQWNLGRNVRIHTIAIGGKSDFLEQLAKDSGGEHSVAR